MALRLIFLSWAYPPMEFPRAVQVERMARRLRLRPVEIVCAAAGKEQAGDGVIVHRVAEPRRTGLSRRLGIGRLLAALSVPDTHRAWAMRAAAHVAQTPLARDDVLVTFGQPMSDHLAGLALKERFGNRWIAHLSDPWADNPFARGVFFRRRNLGLERAVVASTDHVLLTSEEALDLVMAKYPSPWRAKASVLPHAFEADLYPDRWSSGGPLVMRYLGALYGARGPEPVLRALQLLVRRVRNLPERLRVEFIGELSMYHGAAARRLNLPPGLVQFLPPVPYLQALALMRGADILLHLDAPGSKNVFFASKLVDYIGARRPIFGVTPPGTAVRIIGAMGGSTADPGSPDRIASEIEAAIKAVEQDRDSDWGDERTRRRYDIDTVANEFADLIERVGGVPTRKMAKAR